MSQSVTWLSSRGHDLSGRLLHLFVLVYVVAATLALSMLKSVPGVYDTLSNWIAVPLQITAILLTGRLAWRLRGQPGPARQLWVLVFAFSAQNLIASAIWILFRPLGAGPVFSYADSLYLADYWLMACIYSALFSHFGGSFRQPRFWFDAIAIFTTLIAAFWVVLLSPITAPPSGKGPGLLFSLPYSLTLAWMMTMAALLWICLPDFRRQPVSVLLIGAGLAEAVWEINWLASWRTNTDIVGAFYNYGDVLCFAFVILAVAAERTSSKESPRSFSPARSAYTFLPTLASLLTLALVAGTIAGTRSADSWILIGLVVFSALLLVTRHNAVIREIAALNLALVAHEVDARLTELARQSADLFLIIDKSGAIAFASPAAEMIVGRPAESLPGNSVLKLFGTGHEVALTGFLARLAATPDYSSSIELAWTNAGKPARVLKMSGANRMANRHIRGITMTVSDVTEQRAMEREVLDAANQERLRLASDIHDGLGQELTGISMLLQSAATAPDPDPKQQSAFLNIIVGHMRTAIRSSRELAYGLSPIYVVRGSLSGALQRLSRREEGRQPVRVHIDPSFEDKTVGDFHADHLYRIAREAVRNALQHSGGTEVTVALSVLDGRLLLVIADDGIGLGPPQRPDRSLGMRLMEYRARVIGGGLKIDSDPSRGTRLELTVPLENDHAAAE